MTVIVGGREYEVIVEVDQEDRTWLVARVPELPRCISQGLTDEEVEANITEAIELWLDWGVTGVESE